MAREAELATEPLPDGWLVEAEASELARLASGIVVLELGSWKGRSTTVLASTAAYVLSIDSHLPMAERWQAPDDTLADYLANVRDLENVGSLVGEFAAATLFRRDAFGLVFVDGVHDFDSVVADLKLAREFDCPTAVHDWGRYGVTRAAKSLGLWPSNVVGSLAVIE